MSSGRPSLSEIPHATNTEKNEHRSGLKIMIFHGNSMERARSFEANPASRYASVELA
jgi:hypothetical protein